MIRVTTDFRQGLRVTEKVLRQFPFATSKALNDMALLFQAEQRRHQETVFTIRAKTWWHRAVKVSRFARKDSLTAIVEIDPAGARRSWVDIFERHEEGGERRPKGGRHLAIPIEAGRTARGIVRKPERPRRAIERGAFIVHLKNGRAGVFRRQTKKGRGRKKFIPPKSPEGRVARAQGLDPNLQFLYYLIPDADIDAVYDFFANADEIWAGHWEEVFRKNVLKALETARPSVRRARRGSRITAGFPRIPGPSSF